MIRTYIPRLLRLARGLLSSPLSTFIEVAVKCTSHYRVHGGPFNGMIFHSPTLPMLLGTYEMETHPAIVRIRDFEIDRVINIGAAVGFYAIGFARLFPRAAIHTFEVQTSFRAMMEDNEIRNSMPDRIIPQGLCTITDVDRLTGSPGLSVVVIDVEGAELELLDPAKAPSLAQSLVFVELHDIHIPGCTDTIRGRFRETHEIQEFFTSERLLPDFPFHWMTSALLGWIPGYHKALVASMSEFRPGPQNWFLMLPKERSYQKVDA